MVSKFACPVALALFLLSGGAVSAAPAQPPAQAAPAPTQDESLVAVLPVAEGRKLYKAYAESPRKKDKVTYWAPTAQDVQTVETALRDLSKTETVVPAKSHWPSAVDIMTYDRQYAGATVNGKPLIVVNGFIRDLPSFFADAKNGWRTHAVFVADGGYAFFHAFYDVKQHQFTRFSFNGFA